jgi:hypothetical protein
MLSCEPNKRSDAMPVDELPNPKYEYQADSSDSAGTVTISSEIPDHDLIGNLNLDD